MAHLRHKGFAQSDRWRIALIRKLHRLEPMECLAGSQLADLLNGSASSELALHIDAHVDRCADCRHLLLNLARVISSSQGRGAQATSAALAPQLLTDDDAAVSRRYRILGLLGEGGMGRVYRVFDRLLRSEVALKQVVPSSRLREPGSPVGASPDVAEVAGDTNAPGPVGQITQRLLSKLSDQEQRSAPTDLSVLAEEFRTLSTLRHPNIVSVLDYGFDAAGQPFYTMELLHGAQPLLDFAQGRSAGEQIELLTQLLYALAYLHRRGIVHRDLTPRNVLVVDSSDGPTVKVVDFGLAIDTDNRREISVAGTLLYMAPELFLGEKASELSDLYSVGMLAYQMLTGRYPFPVERGASQLLKGVLGAAPELSLLPAALRPVVGKALSKTPGDRQADAATLLRELAAAADFPLQSEPVSTRDSYLLAARFVGRRVELEQLQAALGAAQHGRGSAWLLGGESGVGKSRLLEELRSGALQAGVLTLRGQAMAGGAAYHLWQDVLKLITLHVPLSDLEASAIGAILPDLPLLLERDVPASQTLDPSSARLRLLHIIDETLARLPGTALVLLEDLQWVDSESLALLSHIANGTRERSLLIVAAYRADEAVRLVDALPQLQKLQLPRLSRMEMGQLCQAMLGRAGQDPELLNLVAAETEGNAYFIVEVMRALASDTGSLASVGQRGLPRHIFAGGIEQVLTRRLLRVPASARPLLQLAAVSGRQLDLSLLSHLLPQAESQLRELADIGLLELYLQRWRFSHDKLRERVSASLGDGERKQLHASLAAALEQLHPGDPSHASQIAIHYQQAQQPTKAARFFGVAGEAALRGGAPGEAAALLEQARALHEQIKMPRLAEVQLWRGLTESRFGLGRLREAEAALRQLCTLAGTPLPTDPVQLWSMVGRLLAQLLGHRLGISHRAPLTDPEQRAVLTELLAGLGVEEVFVWTDQPELGLLCTLFGMRLEDQLGLAPRRNYHRSALFFILSHTPLRGLCLRYMERTARHDAQVLNGTHAEIDFLRVRALVEINDGQIRRAAQHAAQAVALARAYKDDVALLHSLLQLQLTAAGLDDFPQMLQVSREMEPLALRAEDHRYLALAYVGQGAAQLNMGKYTESVELLEKARACLPQELGPVPESVTLGLLASGARHLRQLERAAELAEQALSAVQRARWPLAQLRHPLVCILDAYLASEQPKRHQAQIRTALASLHGLARRFPQAAPDDEMFHGRYYWRFGEPGRALRAFRKSIAVATKLDMKIEKAVAQYWLGCFARSPAGRGLVSEGAEPHLRAALATFERVQAAGMVALTRAEMPG